MCTLMIKKKALIEHLVKPHNAMVEKGGWQNVQNCKTRNLHFGFAQNLHAPKTTVQSLEIFIDQVLIWKM